MFLPLLGDCLAQPKKLSLSPGWFLFKPHSLTGFSPVAPLQEVHLFFFFFKSTLNLNPMWLGTMKDQHFSGPIASSQSQLFVAPPCPTPSGAPISNQQHCPQLLLRAVSASMLRSSISEGVYFARLWLLSLPAFPLPRSCVSRCPLGKDLLKPIITIYLIFQNTLSTQEQLTAEIITQA